MNGIFLGRWFSAKVYDTPSRYGINGGRVSKLIVSHDRKRCTIANCAYHYDRGVDVNNISPEYLINLLSYLESV